jgi:hypothetical protein
VDVVEGLHHVLPPLDAVVYTRTQLLLFMNY